MDGKSILIVGGAGFVGSNLAHFIIENFEPKEIIIIDNLLSSTVENIPVDDRVNFLFGSVTDNELLEAIPSDIDFVFHLACFHGNQSSIANPMADHQNNTLTSLKLFERLHRFSKLEKVIYAAAGCAVAEKTYEEAVATPEDAPVSLFHDSPYSISKLIGEMYGNFYWAQHGLPFVKARFQNVYGPREVLGAGQWRGTVHTVWRNVTPSFIWRSLNGEALPLDNAGNMSRDFIFVKDMARGLVACALKGVPGEAYNLASGRETTIASLAEKINQLTGNRTPVDLRPARSWDRSGRRFGSTEKAEEKLGFSASVLIDEGLARTVEWTIENRELIAASISKHNILMSQSHAN